MKAKELLVNAFKHGGYKQGIRLLRPANDTFCALGVIADTYINHKKGLKWHFSDREHGWYIRDFKIYRASLPARIVEWSGLGLNDISYIIKMNDRQDRSFDYIAEYIERGHDLSYEQMS